MDEYRKLWYECSKNLGKLNTRPESNMLKSLPKMLPAQLKLTVIASQGAITTNRPAESSTTGIKITSSNQELTLY